MFPHGEILRSAVCVVTGCIITVVCLKMWQMKVRSRNRGNRGERKDGEREVDGDEARRLGDQGVQVDGADRQGEQMEPRVPQEHDCQILLRSKCKFLCLSSGKKTIQFYMPNLIRNVYNFQNMGLRKLLRIPISRNFSDRCMCVLVPIFINHGRREYRHRNYFRVQPTRLALKGPYHANHDSVMR